MEWQKLDTGLEARRIMITNHDINGKTLAKLGLFGGFSFNITRVNSGIDLVAHPNLQLQVGDRVTVVGSSSAIENVEKLLGNSMLKLRQPNLGADFSRHIFRRIAGVDTFCVSGNSAARQARTCGRAPRGFDIVEPLRPQIQMVTLHNRQRELDAEGKSE